MQPFELVARRLLSTRSSRRAEVTGMRAARSRSRPDRSSRLRLLSDTGGHEATLTSDARARMNAGLVPCGASHLLIANCGAHWLWQRRPELSVERAELAQLARSQYQSSHSYSRSSSDRTACSFVVGRTRRVHASGGSACTLAHRSRTTAGSNLKRGRGPAPRRVRC